MLTALMNVFIILGVLAVVMAWYLSPAFLGFVVRLGFRRADSRLLNALVGISFFVVYQFFYYPDTTLGRTHTDTMEIVLQHFPMYSAMWVLHMFFTCIAGVVEMCIYSLLSSLGVGLADKILGRMDRSNVEAGESDEEDEENLPTVGSTQ
ncbi:MAG: hypothetical protein KC964_04305 [Candidatus Omnitrophica bacterium]|nr:hypothetical protein [Candidatus Omnitrophota bacterium]